MKKQQKRVLLGKLTKLSKERRKWILKMRVRLGLCHLCGTDAPIYSRCNKCHVKHHERQASRRAGLKEQGLCIECGKNKVNKHQYYCKLCATIRGPSHNKAWHKRNALKMGLYVESVEIRVLFKRDKERCRHCNSKLNLNANKTQKRAACIDHIVPLSIGGEHSYKNTQLLCVPCNSSKGNRLTKNGEQLLLFGL